MRKIQISIVFMFIIILLISSKADEYEWKNNKIILNVNDDTLYSVSLEGNEFYFTNYLFNFNKVKRLNIYDCLYTKIPPEISEMKELTELYISKCYNLDFNQLFNDLQNIQISNIHLSRNNLSKIPKNISLIKSLESIDLPENLIDTVPKELLEMKNLKSLDLSGNELKYFDTDNNLKNSIIHLNLIDCNLEKFPVGLENLSNLQTIKLKDNPKLELEEICEFVLNFKHLRYLNIMGCKAKEIPKNILNLKNVNLINGGSIFLKDDLKKLREMRINISYP